MDACPETETVSACPEKTFESMDADKDGMITKEELMSNMKHLPACQHMTEEQLSEAFDDTDADEDGKITLDEFKQLVNASRQEA